ncbi:MULTISPECIES: UDP-glucose--hexose-1-phosphate uridylyltransferase [unclassified Planococcus (in: firmicutes)]|uniref:UDP-glucose--hexose-1-phosphate uridylyltransferase n=1 Tax=unclassified Planococcus (in: firmicutes) TaxID=2662419 RepID=UPI000C34C7A0|nr:MULTISPECIES: UDP-glucose--hexose-1-phosphate uridylyltransferase [unclassified Planococcus (in: firmicutes)]AUD13149.1 UDP-glucose--hexose-1-phosphate uridylyltransferase [Planococcus sp. MB-3u-03]PKG45368.1 UDP-glucose--hexose-1-phosphate uridylyltransferase [Planococcus sp. Urea-trap-24]PKG89036.1 UDP-glucose--hexose-1-phosphate uridylyltransferase [Planococcus sp. Urea-3u-39]PKH39375.1 UDP-glucose--hexose-1-phosphate uridylyltransferase [Planococcus sp. MB-3u-09]
MIHHTLAGLIQKALATGLIEKDDIDYARNQAMHLLQLDAFPEEAVEPRDDTIPNLLEALNDYAVENGVIEDLLDDKEMLSANIMNCFVARPSAINAAFNEKYAESPIAATDYFYELSQNSNYIQMNRIRKNISYQHDSPYGKMDITINLSKPEKDPEQIKREREMKQTLSYPKCLLCKENEGYVGRIGYPARANHRVVKIPLTGENWYFQYSPYFYYNEHSILLSEEHRDMKIDRGGFERLLRFTEQFPHYFVGSNADLPIVGGSILSHDHYQAGRYEFAMTRAEDAFTFRLDSFPGLRASVVNWPMSVIRLKSGHIDELVNAADEILQIWKQYSDEAADVLAFSGDTPHNTITPIARKRDGLFEIDLVLRNNRTTQQHPAGIFHPHADVHHIKKENIGLIEVMGLAVLPPRLKQELEQIQEFLLGKSNHVEPAHLDWAEQLKAQYGPIASHEHAEALVREELGKKFVRILEDAGVLKEQQAFKRFIHAVNEQTAKTI